MQCLEWPRIVTVAVVQPERGSNMSGGILEFTFHLVPLSIYNYFITLVSHQIYAKLMTFPSAPALFCF